MWTLFFNNDPARQAFKRFKNVKFSGDDDATVLDIVCLNAVIAVTVNVLKRNVLGKDHSATGARVVINYDSFQGGENDVDCVEIGGSSQTSTGTTRKIIRKEAEFRWISVGFLNFTSASLADNSLRRWYQSC